MWFSLVLKKPRRKGEPSGHFWNINKNYAGITEYSFSAIGSVLTDKLALKLPLHALESKPVRVCELTITVS